MPREAISLLTDLDDAQRRAASALEGPVRIMAVAGAGKTRTITRRIAYGCASGKWDPERCVAVTFSVKAAREMKQRLNKLGAGRVTAETFHALALSQLRSVWSEVTDSYFPQLITDASEVAEGSIERETDLVGASPRELRDILAEISWTKVGLIAPQEYGRVCAAFHRQPPAGLSADQMAAVITDFERQKSERNLIDFNDILLILCHIIEESDEVAASVRKRIGWLTVDEYQDVSPLQHRLMGAWLGKNTNVCVVGDPAQTIYSFAGATSYYLLDFEREFKGLSADVRLDTDYRSTAPIVGYANKILGASPLAGDYVPLVPAEASAETSVASPRARGVLSAPARVTTRVFGTDEQEAAGVAKAVRKLLDAGVDASEIAVLSRINSQTRAICMACDQLTIPYMVRRMMGQGMDETSFSRAVRNGVTSGEIESLNSSVVTISTIHAAKGLEWDHVFIIGASEGLIPFGSAIDDAQIEEERRLLYVAVTRGRKHVALSYARKKDEHTGFERARSRFL
ncbi:MAG: ATP-dependent helicase [Bifidobacteriaceae bacterium]|nr:ATP-dependent helicase [Bifidobacteriaceae bacterium]